MVREDIEQLGAFVSGDRIAFQPGNQQLYLFRPTIYPTFWGRQWDEPGSPLPQQKERLIQFLEVFAAGDTQVQQRMNAQVQSLIGQPDFFPGRVERALTIPVDPEDVIEDKEIRHWLLRVADDASLSAAPPNSIRVVFLPPATSVTVGAYRSCIDFCGYHGRINTSDGQPIDPPVVYAVIAYADCGGCQREMRLRTPNGYAFITLSVEQSLTVTASHEIINAATDSQYAEGMWDPAHNELADVCSDVVVRSGDFLRRGIWNDQDRSCQ